MLPITGYTIKKNVDRIEDAELIFFGESHTDDNHLKSNAHIIDRLYKTGEIVFVEAEENALVKYSSSVKYVKSPIIIKGWDLSIGMSAWLGNYFIPTMRNLVKPIALFSVLSVIWTITIGKSYYGDILKPVVGGAFLFLSFAREFSNQVYVQLPPRNRNMFKILDNNHPCANKRSYIIAGAAHLWPAQIADNTVAMKELGTYLSNKKYAILIPPIPSGTLAHGMLKL